MNTHPDALALRGVVKLFGATTAVNGVDLRVETGSRVALLGLNGAGKTTTISMILGLLRPDAGSVHVLGLSPKAAVRAGLVGAMLQSSRVPPRATVADVVRLATRLYPSATPVTELLDVADLAALARRRVDRLSGGEVQRLKFAVAIAGRPQLLMLDEPTTAMDVPSRQAFWSRMRAYAGTGRTVVYCTHLLDEAADADAIVIMRDGRVVAQGTAAELERAAAGTTVSTAADVVDAERLPGVDRVDRQNGQTSMVTTDPDTVVCALAARGLVRNLRIDPGGLDAAFLALARRPEPTAHEASETSR